MSPVDYGCFQGDFLMSYVRKLMAQDEKLIGIARLHWIYVLKGLLWFVILAGAGWLFNAAMTRALFAISESMNSVYLPSMLMSMSNGVMFFLMGGGFFVFLLFVINVLTTEIGLSTRRVMHKRGWIFVNVKQIDLEEIRGENLDLGYFGRILGYGYILLDCRFIGDIRLPAIEHPERFMRALHQARAETQDTLQMVVGKTGRMAPVQVAPEESMQDPQPKIPKPEILPGQQPQPEIQPDQPAVPEIQPEPTPHSPPAAPPSQQPIAPPAQPQQPVPNPGPNPQPPLQPPGSPTSAAITPETVAQVVAQVTPQIAQEVVEQLKEQGILKKPAPENDNAAEDDIDKNLIADFDEARFQDEDPHERFNKMEHAIH